MRITADVVLRARAFINPVKDRELDLRGLKIPLIENLGVTQDQFDTIDLSDNEVKRLENFPRLRRLKTILLSNNFVARIGNHLGEQIPELESVVLSNNKVASLSEIDHLAALPKLAYLSLVDNPVVRQQHYRAYVIHKLPNLKVLDFKKIKFDERKTAAKLFRSEAGRKLEEEVAKEGKVIASEAAAAAPENRVLTEEQKRIAAEMIDRATTPEELDRVERQLRAGIFKLPDGSTLPPPAPAPVAVAAPSSPSKAPPAKKQAVDAAAKPPPPPSAPPAPAAAPPAPPIPVVAPTSPPEVSEPPPAQSSPIRQSGRTRSPSKRAREEETEENYAAEEEVTAAAESVISSMEVDGIVNGEGDGNGTAEGEQVPPLSEAEIDKMKVAELKDALKERGLSTLGLKAELVERLKSHGSG